jgi:fructosamine-3-kinase
VAALEDRLESILGARPTTVHALSGGCISPVWRVSMPSGEVVAVKEAAPGASLETEAWMLGHLRERSDLPVPDVFFGDASILVMEYLDGTGRIDGNAAAHAADLVAALHGVTADAFGLSRDTLIGSLDQPNPWTQDWIEFFRDQRLLYMAEECLNSRQLPTTIFNRIENLAARLGDIIPPPAAPSLIHGDLWGGNILARDGRITGFIDPAVYYADPEIELAFSTLFNTFGKSFFDRYQEHRPLRDGFFETRCQLYNLYPLLVHTRLFGGGYVAQVEAVLDRLKIS